MPRTPSDPAPPAGSPADSSANPPATPPATPPLGDPLPPAPARSPFFRIFFSIMLPMFTAVVDQPIVAPALPALARPHGGVARLSCPVCPYLVDPPADPPAPRPPRTPT